MINLLFIDAYDSFTNNIIALLHERLSASVTTIKINDERFVLNDDGFYKFLQGFDAVVAGPGPGHPANSEDIGLIGKLWHLPSPLIVPVLGVCLGFQSLGLAYGAKVERLHEPRHGMITCVKHCNNDIFETTGDLVATQYHSLHVRIGNKIDDFWTPAPACKELVPLAWDFDDVRNGPILMAVRHLEKPFWGVQFHPESVCTNVEAQHMIERWAKAVQTWNALKLVREKPLSRALKSRTIPRTSEVTDSASGVTAESISVESIAVELNASMTPASIVEALCCDCEPLLLESGTLNGNPVNPETGRYSIIGLQDRSSLEISYSTANHHLCISQSGEVFMTKKAPIDEVFNVLEDFMKARRATNGPKAIPFWGGLIGYLSYEAGLETIEVAPSNAHVARPDVFFIFVERSIVVDHRSGLAYIQTLREDDSKWIAAVREKLAMLPSSLTIPKLPTSLQPSTVISQPSKTEYCRQVELCQSYLRAGSSYELCLTDESTVKNSATPWDIYLQLRRNNPAPFGAYLRLRCIDVIGSSPERFLSWDREGACQFRPIKGTVKKTPEMTRQKAEEVLSSPKEKAENLMIVDLIRHDLHGVPGIHNLQTPTLMSVEEYPSVFQLVSVISGNLPTCHSRFSALSRSLPPGSMTGAPKKRSCELLQQLERGRARGLYSGVLGYFDVGGGGDFSVVIRTAFKWTNKEEEQDVWRVGAGGAVTILSESEAEWEEMCAKRERLMNVLCHDSN
nr:putative aminodeoxychorismate synthase [Quercus suber]